VASRCRLVEVFLIDKSERVMRFLFLGNLDYIKEK